MRVSYLAIALLVFCFTTQSQALTRLEESRQAQLEFLKLDFFAEGRGMIMSPGLITAYNLAVPGLGVIDKKTFTKRWGMVYDSAGEIAGLHNNEFESHRIGTIGCAGCHSGRAAGRYVVGLGNKNIDVFQLGRDVSMVENFWRGLVPIFMKSRTYVETEDFAMGFSEYLANAELGNLTQGLVPVSFIRGWFYKVQNQPVPRGIPKGQVKVPFLWGYSEKRKVGQFCDGFGDGSQVGWAVAVELTAGQHPDAVRRYHQKIVDAENLFDKFLPPKYPFAVDADLAAKGRELFAVTCARCHGTYENDDAGLPIFKEPLRIPWVIVRTDNDRLLGNTEAFVQLVAASPLNDIIKVKYADHGYFAPRLNGVWSRFPYLHNGSVPTLADLLSPENDRPVVFSLRDSGEEARFDRSRVGLTLPRSAQEAAALDRDVERGARDVYSTKRVGHSNAGHPFYTELPADQKSALLEYLKTL